MNENLKWYGGAVAVVGLMVGAVVYRDRWWSDRPVQPDEPVAAVPARPAVPVEPAVRHPLPAAPAQEPLPTLDTSDVSMQGALEGLVGKEFVERFVITKDLVRHIVVTIDNLPDQKVAERIRPIKQAPGQFLVGGSQETPVLSPANYERYEPLVQLVRSLDTQQLIATYTRYYPLFQEAYESLGHPPQYFNDRVIEVIDHLLATPEVHDPIALAQPNVQFEYADPKLESRSAGQKVLIRMGSDNAAAVKAKLRELRSALSSSARIAPATG